ncbi:MAG: substrate-binding domain-containing protein [Armatimonadota bacterium]|nr:substrate-binding domain-containing protein [Armatimonadota bacterium]
MKKIAAVLAAVAVAATLSSCAKRATSTGPVVGVTLLTKAHPFYQQMEKAMKEEAAARNMTLRIQSAETQLGTQNSQVDGFITQKVAAIVICPVDSASIVGAIRRANDAKIPVFTADIAAKGGDVVCHIASDNVAGGRLAGEHMVKLLKGKGEIVVIDYPTVTSVQDRTKGFMEAVGKSQIKVVGRPNGDADRAKSMAAMDNMLQAHPGIKGVFAINDNTALGVLASLSHAKRTDIVVVGYDGDPEAREAILAGSPLKADAVQYPREIGKTTIEMVSRHLSGEKVPANKPVEVGIIDKESLEAEKKQ